MANSYDEKRILALEAVKRLQDNPDFRILLDVLKADYERKLGIIPQCEAGPDTEDAKAYCRALERVQKILTGNP